MVFKMKGSAFKMNEIATKSALKHLSSPIKLEEDDDKYAPKDHLFTEGKGKRKRFEQREDSTGSNIGEVRWIRDNYGTNLSKKELRRAQMAYYDIYKPEEKIDEEVYPQVMPTPREKEKRYPTNPDDRQTRGFLPIDEVWDPTVNEGEGGYVRVEPTKVDPNEEIPEFEGDIIVD